MNIQEKEVIITYINTIESFLTLLKRGIIGQLHKVSKQYLNNYIDEFCFRLITDKMRIFLICC